MDTAITSPECFAGRSTAGLSSNRDCGRCWRRARPPERWRNGRFGPKGYAKWAHEGFQFFTLGYVRDGNVEKAGALLQETRDLIGS
jgi:hypothetical protein